MKHEPDDEIVQRDVLSFLLDQPLLASIEELPETLRYPVPRPSAMIGR